MRLVAELCRGLRDSLFETLPQDDREAGIFLAGMCWAFVIYVVLLVGVSYLTTRAFGWAL